MLFFILSAVVLAAAAQETYPRPYDVYPEWYINSDLVQRLRRDVSTLPDDKVFATMDKKMGDGRVFGTIGQNGNGLYGKAGYDRQIFNDNRGKLNGELYSSRVLGPYGDSSHLGGGLKWENSNAAASLDVSRQIHGATSVQAAAGGKWPVGKNGDFSVQGTYGQTSGMRPDYGAMANYNLKW